MIASTVVGTLLVVYGLLQLIFSGWFYERRRSPNMQRSAWMVDTRGMSPGQARFFAAMSILIGVGIIIGGGRLN